MLSVLLACAFAGRQFWGFVADRYGGLRAILAGSACQAAAMIGFLLTQNEAGLFVVSAAFGLGFSGIIPAYVLAIRELFPASEASWRVPTLLLCSGSGMAAGGWMAGAIYDFVGFYAVAFAAGIVFNLANLVVIGALVLRQSRYPSPFLREGVASPMHRSGLSQLIRLAGQQLPIAVLLLPDAKYADFGVGDLAIGLGFRNVKMAYDSSIAGQRDL